MINNNPYTRLQVRREPVFKSPDDESINSNKLDLPSKLTKLFKRGIGRKYVAKIDKKLDAPLTKSHEAYLANQVGKATYDHYVRAITLEIDRRKSYEDYAVMEYTPEIASALDIYADESLTQNEYGEILEIKCEKERIKTILENLFVDILDANHNLWQWTRQTCKYGNHFVLLDVRPEKGVVGFLQLPVQEIRREEAYDNSVNSTKFVWDTQSTEFDAWQVAHFRLLSDMERYPYGTSALESARLVWKQLQLAEDAMIIYRITRAPERRVFYIDTGNLPVEEIPDFIEMVKEKIKKRPEVVETTGNREFRYSPMPVDEDFYIPRRNEKNSQVETLPGASNLDEIGDITYLQSKVFAALKIPKAYLTFDEQLNAKATLSSEDFRFARTINRIQQAILTTLTDIAIVHLYSLGFRDIDVLTSFELSLVNPSTQTELEKLEIMNQRASLFSAMWNPDTISPASFVWGMENIFEFSKEQTAAILKQQYLEGKIKMQIEQSSGGGEAPQFGSDDEQGGDESSYEDESGNPLPSTPPEGKAYVDSETGEVVEESIDRLVELMLGKSKNKVVKRKTGLHEVASIRATKTPKKNILELTSGYDLSSEDRKSGYSGSLTEEKRVFSFRNQGDKQ